MVCRRVPVAGKAHCWLFAAGMFVLLAAMALLLHVSPQGQAEAEQNALYVQVLGVLRQWESCPTCHAAPGKAPALDRVAYTLAHRPIEWPDAAPSRSATQPAAVNSQVVAVGHRLLELLPSGDPQVERAAQAYLAVARTLDENDDAATQITALQRLAQLEAVLRDLQSAANATAFWRAPATGATDSASPVALLSSAGPLLALIVAAPVRVGTAHRPIGRPEDQAESVPAHLTQAISRRGPPAVALVAILDSAPKEDCRYLSVQSSFCA